MATPIVASSALLVRQYYIEGFYPSGTKTSRDGFTPSGALVKATLLSGASSLKGFEADTGLPIDPPPSFYQGFGRVMLGASFLGVGGLGGCVCACVCGGGEGGW